jgi:hypothetical protein
MGKVEQLMKDIESLTTEERNELLTEITKKYVSQSFVVGENYSFWFDGADDCYDHV